MEEGLVLEEAVEDLVVFEVLEVLEELEVGKSLGEVEEEFNLLFLFWF